MVEIMLCLLNMSFDVNSKNKNSFRRGHILEVVKYLTAEDKKPT